MEYSWAGVCVERVSGVCHVGESELDVLVSSAVVSAVNLGFTSLALAIDLGLDGLEYIQFSLSAAAPGRYTNGLRASARCGAHDKWGKGAEHKEARTKNGDYITWTCSKT